MGYMFEVKHSSGPEMIKEKESSVSEIKIPYLSHDQY